MLKRSVRLREQQLRQRQMLLPYPLRRAAAYEMLYGGVRVQHLVQAPNPLKLTRSEELPAPSLACERHDLALEMQLPSDIHNYNNIHMSVQRQLGSEGGAAGAPASSPNGFSTSNFFADQHHPERHHNSSLPYAKYDTTNVLAMRLFPVNLGSRIRAEAIRIRTADCLHRLKDAKACAAVHEPLEYPLSHAKTVFFAARQAERDGRNSTLYAPSAFRASPTSVAAEGAKKDPDSADGEAACCTATVAHLRGAPAHPHPSTLSIFTRPVDRLAAASSKNNSSSTSNGGSYGGAARSASALASLTAPAHPFSLAGSIPAGRSARWLPLQMLKPINHSWSASMRSSGVRGPHMQLMQERLDQKGFGWKKKSRSLWQQDIATAGFRPHRYF